MATFTDFTEKLWRGDTHRFRFVVMIRDPVTLVETIQNITSWQEFWLTAKRSVRDTDTDAIIALDDGLVDFLGPVPLKVGDWLETTDMRALKAALERTARTFMDLGTREFLQDHLCRPAALGSAGDEVV